MAAPPTSEDEADSRDSSEPLRGIVVCCTSIPPEQRTDIANKVAELGGIHKYDLTPDATHLVVGDYDTPKYRHVARERPDVKAMDAAWIEAVSERWRKDEEIDLGALERKYQLKPLAKCGLGPSAAGSELAAQQPLLICLTGFGDQRDDIADKIKANGGQYTADLTRRCTHLIVSKPEGKKFAAARSWDVRTVTLDWLLQSIARGMILDEAKFDPLLPAAEQGVGAWVVKSPRRDPPGKRWRSAAPDKADEPCRKLRRTASMKLSSQRRNLWSDILRRPGEGEAPPERRPMKEGPEEPVASAAGSNGDIFASCVFATHGFDGPRQAVLEETIATLGGTVAASPEAAAACASTGKAPRHRLLVVPQASQPDTHPQISDGMDIVTEFYIERCLHNKRFFPPREAVLGRPFPLFPIDGFSGLTICSAAFTGLELIQVSRSVVQLGAKFGEAFRPTTSLVLCRSLSAMRREKLRYALEWGVPVVAADWLYECISTGFNVPVEGYIFPELRKQYAARGQPRGGGRDDVQSGRGSKPAAGAVPPGAPRRPPAAAGIDATAFESAPGGNKARRRMPAEESTTSADFAMARTRAADRVADEDPRASRAWPVAGLGRSLSPPRRLRSEPTAARSTAGQDTAKSAGAGPSAPAARPNHPQQRQQQQLAAQEDEARRQQAKEAKRKALASKLNSLVPDGDARRLRRRQVLGRAASNTSNGGSSAASLDGDGAQGVDARPPLATQLQYGDPEALEHKAAVVSKMLRLARRPDSQAAPGP